MFTHILSGLSALTMFYGFAKFLEKLNIGHGVLYFCFLIPCVWICYLAYESIVEKIFRELKIPF